MKEQITDRSPREIWDEMQSLVRLTEIDKDTGKPKHLDLERHIWLLTLPPSIRILLDGAEDMEMDELIHKAEALAIACRTTRGSQNSILSVSRSDSGMEDTSTSEGNIRLDEADHYYHDAPINSLERKRFYNTCKNTNPEVISQVQVSATSIKNSQRMRGHVLTGVAGVQKTVTEAVDSNGGAADDNTDFQRYSQNLLKTWIY